MEPSLLHNLCPIDYFTKSFNTPHIAKKILRFLDYPRTEAMADASASAHDLIKEEEERFTYSLFQSPNRPAEKDKPDLEIEILNKDIVMGSFIVNHGRSLLIRTSKQLKLFPIAKRSKKTPPCTTYGLDYRSEIQVTANETLVLVVTAFSKATLLSALDLSRMASFDNRDWSRYFCLLESKPSLSWHRLQTRDRHTWADRLD